MNLKISQKLKELRTGGNITQKALAEYLGVSEQAISRWENGTCYPDIELLPSLASYFSISVDELLGCDDKSRELAEKLIEEFTADPISEDTVEKAKHALTVLPNKPEIMVMLGAALFSIALPQMKHHEERARALLEQVVTISKRVFNVTGFGDDEVVKMTFCTTAQTLLTSSLKHLGRMDEALEYASYAPSIHCSREFLMISLQEGEAKAAYLHELVSYFTMTLAVDMFSGIGDSDEISQEKKFEYLTKVIALYDAVYGSLEEKLPDAKYSDMIYMAIHIRAAQSCAKAGDSEKCAEHFRIAARCCDLVDKADGISGVANRAGKSAFIRALFPEDAENLRMKKSRDILKYFLDKEFADKLEEDVADSLRGLLKR